MEQLDDYVAKKRKIAAHYCEALQHVTGIAPMKNAPWAESTFWMYTILVDEKECPKAPVMNSRRAASKPVPFGSPCTGARCIANARSFTVNPRIGSMPGALSLPCSVGLSELDQDRVIAALLK